MLFFDFVEILMMFLSFVILNRWMSFLERFLSFKELFFLFIVLNMFIKMFKFVLFI